MDKGLNYGIIGNCRSAALVSSAGSIDWCCLPDPDSDPVFAALLDEKAGGSFRIDTDEHYSISQKYEDDTNILITSYSNETSVFRIIDFMPRYKTEGEEYYNPPEIIRIISVQNGRPVIRVNYDPRPNFASSEISLEINSDCIKCSTTTGRYESLYCYTNMSKEKIIEKQPVELTGDLFFIISYNQKLTESDLSSVRLDYYRTQVYWMNWSSRTRKFEKYQKEIIRSALVLKLLTYQRTGAIIASVTTSLPEALNEKRNWDYRYCWIRDSSMIIKVLLEIGHSASARRFLKFILNLNEGKNENIQIMYGIRGEKKLEEKIVRHLRGYKGSKPVRKGNSAYIQKQHDIYGILMDAIYLSMMRFPSTQDTFEELWTFVRGLVSLVRQNWKKPDRGIWEIRKDNDHYVFSKVLSWVAVDRACRIASMIGKEKVAEEWSFLKEEIHNDIYAKGWNKELKSFTQTYDSKNLDASLLLTEDYGFINSDDPMFISTVRNISETLTRNGMMFRYINEDDFGKPKNSLIVCTFWLIDALYKTGRREEAGQLFERMLNASNHLGLYSEHLDISTGELLGNFPQGYSHIGLIKAALTLNNTAVPQAGVNRLNFIKP